ncbi:hypothetical protein Fot_07780 [Forsythia ovata]|uniref:Uncharacterized protein n=1 Tax=Forsythia ovata TaxID=205694 RepID=A0ABD1WWS7_9LAMI
MSGFHFSKVPKFKIRRGEVVEDASLLHLASSTASGSRPTVLQEREMAVGNPHIPPAPKVTADIPSLSIFARPVPPPRNVRQSVKKKPGAESGEQASRSPHLPLLVSTNTLTLGPARTSWIQQS